MFWESTIPEVTDLIEASVKRREQEQNEKKAEMKFSAVLTWSQVSWICQSFSKNSSDKNLYDYFPELFSDELEELKELKRKNDELRHKAQMIELANRLRNRK